MELGQPIVLEANKNKFLDKGTNKQQGTGQIKQIRKQYTSPTQQGKEFRNPPPYNSNYPDILPILMEIRKDVNSNFERLKETTKMVCELHEEFMEFLSRPGGQQPPQDEMDIGGGEDDDSSNKENKPPSKH